MASKHAGVMDMIAIRRKEKACEKEVSRENFLIRSLLPEHDGAPEISMLRRKMKSYFIKQDAHMILDKISVLP